MDCSGSGESVAVGYAFRYRAKLPTGKGTKAKSVTSCDNAFVTSILLARRPAGNLFATKAKRQEHRGTSDEEAEAMLVESEPAVAEIHFLQDSTNSKR